LAEARQYFEGALTTADAVGEPVFAGIADAELGLLDAVEGEPQRGLDRALSRLERALSAGAGMTIPHLLNEAAVAEIALGQLEAGARRLELAIPPIENEDVYVAGWCFPILADAQRLLDDTAAAERSALRGVEIGESSGHPLVVRANGLILGRLAAARGEWATAEQHALAMLDACAERGYALWMPETLEALAEVAAGLERDRDAARLLGAAARARSDLGLARWKGDGEYWGRFTGDLQARLGDEFATAWASGESLSLEETIAWASRARGERKRPAIGQMRTYSPQTTVNVLALLIDWSLVYRAPLPAILTPAGIRAAHAVYAGHPERVNTTNALFRARGFQHSVWARLASQNTPGAHRTAAPILLIVGTADQQIPPATTIALARELRARGDHVRLETLAGAGHDRTFIRGLPAMLSFAHRNLTLSRADGARRSSDARQGDVRHADRRCIRSCAALATASTRQQAPRDQPRSAARLPQPAGSSHCRLSRGRHLETKSAHRADRQKHE
jgi:hypothetical protein